MSGSRICWLLPLALVMFLGLPAQGEESFESQPGPRRFLSKEAAQELWAQYQKNMINHAAKARDVALHYWSEKYNTTFFTAPGEPTHILMETVYGRIYHVVMKLVKVDCPKDSMNPRDCKIEPGSPILTCKLAVIIFFQHDKGYLSEEGCQEGQDTPTTSNSPEEQHFPPPNEKEEEPYPYV